MLRKLLLKKKNKKKNKIKKNAELTEDIIYQRPSKLNWHCGRYDLSV